MFNRIVKQPEQALGIEKLPETLISGIIVGAGFRAHRFGILLGQLFVFGIGAVIGWMLAR